MKNGHFEEHWTDENDMPAGGISCGRGFTISWQNGPLGRGNDRKEPNGAFIEDVLAAMIGRLEFYQRTSNRRFACETNAAALRNLHRAASCLDARTKEREKRGVEGTHEK